ncbi:hypothetical protein [Ureaplasma diversum]|uniref:hypothetical protein n=1 Tax=Ureaplasma diversum TaxID=42094 RepID=UPI0005708461|nr:hypothetical protein [Ureaplasma diversum]
MVNKKKLNQNQKTKKPKPSKSAYTKEIFDPAVHLPKFVDKYWARGVIYDHLKTKFLGISDPDAKFNWFTKWEYDPEKPFYPGEKDDNEFEYLVKLYWMAALYALESNYMMQVGKDEYNRIVDRLYRYFWSDVKKTKKYDTKSAPHYDLSIAAINALKRANEQLEELYKKLKEEGKITSSDSGSTTDSSNSATTPPR